MKVSETTQKIYEGISNILKENGQALTKAQIYAVESMVETIEESVERRCCEVTEQIVAKKDVLLHQKDALLESRSSSVQEETLSRVNEMVERRIEQLKKDMPKVLDYAKMKKLQKCVESIKDAVGYDSDEMVEKVRNDAAKMLHSTKSFIETQAKTISERSASLSESTKTVKSLQEKVKQMQATLDAKEKQMVESTRKNAELVQANQNLQKKVEESRKINETLEEKRKSESLKYYLEQKIATYPKYEAGLLRKHFQNARSRAEIDENFPKVLAMVQEKRDAMRTVQAIPVAKVEKKPAQEAKDDSNKTISGETIVNESGGQTRSSPDAEDYDDSFVDIDFDKDTISLAQMEEWMSRC